MDAAGREGLLGEIDLVHDEPGHVRFRLRDTRSWKRQRAAKNDDSLKMGKMFATMPNLQSMLQDLGDLRLKHMDE